MSPISLRSRHRLLAAASVAAILLAGGTPPATAEEPAAAIPAPTGASASAAGVTLPGVAPGAAHVEMEDDAFTLSNAALAVTFRRNGAVFVPASIRNALSGVARDVPAGRFFSAILSDGTRITDADLREVSAPKAEALAAVDSNGGQLSEESAGQTVTAEYEYAGAGAGFRITWVAMLRDDSNYVNQYFTVTPTGADVALAEVTLMSLDVPGGHVEGTHSGNPVVVGETGLEDVFFGLENPMSKATVSSAGFALSLPSKLKTTTASPYQQSTAIGVSQPGQLRRSFDYYVQRERASERRTYLHYQSWYDNRITNEQLDAAQLEESMKIFGDALTARDVDFDGYFIDSGWDYKRSPQVEQDAELNVWDFDPTQFPDGFAPQSALAGQYDAGLGVWMSPFGGYDRAVQLRLQLNASKPADQRFELASNGLFKLSGERYYAWFRQQAFRMIDEEGVSAFKLDGIGGGLGQTGPNATYLEDYEALLRLTAELREHKPDVWINATVGTWASPYWLWYVDSIWRDGGDAGQSGAGSPMQRNITYRDQISRASRQTPSPLLPVSALMNHGFIFSDRANGPWDQNTDLTNPDVIRDVRSSAKAYFGLGLGLQEMYVKPGLARPGTPGADVLWDAIAENAKWARANERLLTDTRFIGPSPSSGKVYGTASWNGEKGGQGIVMLRNPAAAEQTFTVDPVSLFELPAGYTTRYAFTERDGAVDDFVADAGRPFPVTLKPFEVLLLKGVPTSAAPGGDLAVVERAPLPRTGWTATATTQETSGENGRASNVLDGDPSTIWHTKWSETRLPQSITVDTGTATTFDQFRYTPRPGSGTPLNGVIAGYTIESSDDGAAWTKLAEGTWTTWRVEDVKVPETTARYVRLTANSSMNGKLYAAVAEIDLFHDAAPVVAPTGEPLFVVSPDAERAPFAASTLDPASPVETGAEVTIGNLSAATYADVITYTAEGEPVGTHEWTWTKTSDEGTIGYVAPDAPGDYVVIVQDRAGHLLGQSTLTVVRVPRIHAPAEVAQGGTATVTLTGFPAGATLKARFAGDPAVIGTAETDADGAAEFTIRLRPAVAPGAHALTIALDDDKTVIAETEITVGIR